MKKYFFLVLCISTYLCAEAESKDKDIANDIKINADSMQYDTSRQYADAKGNVRLSYVVNGLLVTLKASELHAQFDDQGNLISATAEGQVEIEYNDSKLYATRCAHNFNTNKAICTGEDVKLLQENNELHGKEATLDILTHVFTMQANQQDQVTCVVYPKQKEE